MLEEKEMLSESSKRHAVHTLRDLFNCCFEKLMSIQFLLLKTSGSYVENG